MSCENPTSRACDPAATTSGNQPMKAEKNSNSKAAAVSSNMGKALAERAVYGSQQRRTGRRRRNLIHDHGIRLLPSRLSKVSLADHNSSPSD